MFGRETAASLRRDEFSTDRNLGPIVRIRASGGVAALVRCPLAPRSTTFNWVCVSPFHAMVDKDELRQQFTEAFEGADYPVNSPMDLVPALPQGPGTTFESGDFSMTAMELNTKAGGQQEFPYDSVDELVDDIMDGLEEQDYI